LGDEYMKNKAERWGFGGEYMQPEKMVNCTTDIVNETIE